MKMKHWMTLIGTIFLAVSASGQSVNVTKEVLSKIFKENAKGVAFGWKKSEWSKSGNSEHKRLYDCWSACNDDSSYFHSDTIVLYNYNYAYYDMDCKQQFEWCHSRGKAISFIISEPPYGTVFPGVRYWNLKEKDSALYLKLYKDGVVEEHFEVLSLELQYHREQKDAPMYILTLKRNTNPNKT